MPKDSTNIDPAVLQNFSINRIASVVQNIVHSELMDWIPDLIDEGLNNPVGTFAQSMHEQNFYHFTRYQS